MQWHKGRNHIKIKREREAKSKTIKLDWNRSKEVIKTIIIREKGRKLKDRQHEFLVSLKKRLLAEAAV